LVKPEQGVSVSFQVFDVDNPDFNSNNDPYGQVDNESLAADNNSNDWRLLRTGSVTVNGPVATATTDANGIATVEFLVSTQPGDNWRAVATAVSGGLDGLHAAQDDGTQARVLTDKGYGLAYASATAVASPMLVAWRTLHVEVDSMGPVKGNTITGTITAVSPVDATANTDTLTVMATSPNDPLKFGDQDRFRPGKLTTGGKDWLVMGNTENGTATFNVVIDVTDNKDPLPMVGAQFTLNDDDQLKDGQDVPMPDTSTLAAAMKVADVAVDLNYGKSQDNLPFIRNLSETQKDQPMMAQNWDSKADNNANFWVTYIMGAYQPFQVQDGDPNNGGVGDGEEGKAVLGYSSPDTGVSFIYEETLRDSAITRKNLATLEQNAVVHEVGHAVSRVPGHPITESETRGGQTSTYTLNIINRIQANKIGPRPLG